MDYHKGLDHVHHAEEEIWLSKVTAARLNGHLCSWMSSFHSKNLSCYPEGGFLNGSYNLCQKFVFEDGTDGTAWLLRLPRVSNICSQHADEKVMMEVEALDIIRKRTTVPVPEVKAWGCAEDDPLGLGLFDFIHGTCLSNILTQANSRLLKEGVSDRGVEFVYRQMARFMLQIFEIDFDRIGSLPTLRTGYSAPVRPLTWKVHDILHTGSVDAFGDRT